jgi:hypothetical protein
VQEIVEEKLGLKLPRYAVEPAIVKHLLQSAIATPTTMEELSSIEEWARTDLKAIVTSVLCCNLKFVLPVLFSMLRRSPGKRGGKRKAAKAVHPPRKRGRPRKRQETESEAESEVESESEPVHEEEGDEGSDENIGGDQEVMAVLDSSLYVARSEYLVSSYLSF